MIAMKRFYVTPTENGQMTNYFLHPQKRSFHTNSTFFVWKQEKFKGIYCVANGISFVQTGSSLFYILLDF